VAVIVIFNISFELMPVVDYSLAYCCCYYLFVC